MYYEDTIQLDGMSFAVYLDRDDFTREPWKEYDGHGPVSDWTSRDKRPGELVLCEDHGSKRFYDFQEACRIARRDGWGYMPFPLTIEGNTVKAGPYYAFNAASINEAISSVYRQHRSSISPRQYAAAAARADFERLRAWCNDDWYYAVLQVRLLDDYGDVIAKSDCLGGVESDGWQYCAEDLARELIADLQKMAA